MNVGDPIREDTSVQIDRTFRRQTTLDQQSKLMQTDYMFSDEFMKKDRSDTLIDENQELFDSYPHDEFFNKNKSPRRSAYSHKDGFLHNDASDKRVQNRLRHRKPSKYLEESVVYNAVNKRQRGSTRKNNLQGKSTNPS